MNIIGSGVRNIARRVWRRARSNNSLTGSLPESYAALSQLQELWAVENNLTGSLPPAYSNLTNLAAVELWSNSLTGEFRVSGLLVPAHCALSSLAAVELWFNSLTSALLMPCHMPCHTPCHMPCHVPCHMPPAVPACWAGALQARIPHEAPVTGLAAQSCEPTGWCGQHCCADSEELLFCNSATSLLRPSKLRVIAGFLCCFLMSS